MRQIAVVDQANDLVLARSLLGLLERSDDLRQLAGRSVGGHTVFAVDLALHGALTQVGLKPNAISGLVSPRVWHRLPRMEKASVIVEGGRQIVRLPKP